MNTRYLFICSALLSFLANGANGGTYQRTKDETALVWNNDPRPGDAATWSGVWDKNGYAKGYGTLTWYRLEDVAVTGSNIPVPKHKVLSRFSGKMVKGKLNGPAAAVDAKGNTFRVTFVNGKLTDWAAGPAPGLSLPRDKPVRVADRKERVRRAELVEAPAEGPAPPSDRPASGRTVAQTSSTDIDDSLRSLISPPSLLKMTRAAESPAPKATGEAGASPQPAPPAPAAVSSPPASPRLTTAEVIGLADAEARGQGYNLGDYQRPEVQYMPGDDTWSVSYDQKRNANGMAETGKQFSVTVEDESKKATLKR